MNAAPTSSCAICGAGALLRDFHTPRVCVTYCKHCEHRAADHVWGSPGAPDYHLQYDQTGFLAALQQTRVRQARRILAMIRGWLPAGGSLLDFGAGRGWFLDAARSAGFEQLAGADSSDLALRLLRERGFEALLAEQGSTGCRELPSASFRPDVLTVLDVLEHLPALEVEPQLRELLRHFRPRLLVLKVPVSSGLLYRSARALFRVGAGTPLEQLYQVGTHPPHFSYFSRRSLKLLLARMGITLLQEQLDLDFEPADLSRRARALQRLGGAAKALGLLAGTAAEVLGLQDSTIVLARVSE
jgi:2-polyprenyl-3-methyl-5-hydroxy-6-metoxy-1,4-benzoquinol methylase